MITNTPTVAHTPTPWIVRKQVNGDYPITGSNLGRVALCDGDYFARNQLNAELIVRAVNSHAALVEALEDLLEYAEAISSPGDNVEKRKARKALEAARGTKEVQS